MSMRQLFDHDTFTFTYLLWDEASRAAVLIDPVVNRVDRDLKLIEELNLTLTHAIDTHVHADHVTGSGLLRDRTGCKVLASHRGAECSDVRVHDGDTIALGSEQIHVIETPGHTDDSVSYRLGDNVFTGDALLIRGCGRTDFQNGDAGQLYASLTDKLFKLPDETRVWPGHDYHGLSVSSIGEEKRQNPRLAGKSEEEFRAIMDNLNLPRPKYLDRAVPANRECGLGVSESELPSPAFVDHDVAAAMDFAGRTGATIVDVREPHEFVGELGHIDGAENIPRAEIMQASLDWDFDTPLLVVCRSGRRSRGVCDQLARRGFRHVVNLRGGMLDVRKSDTGA